MKAAILVSAALAALPALAHPVGQISPVPVVRGDVAIGASMIEERQDQTAGLNPATFQQTGPLANEKRQGAEAGAGSSAAFRRPLPPGHIKRPGIEAVKRQGPEIGLDSSTTFRRALPPGHIKRPGIEDVKRQSAIGAAGPGIIEGVGALAGDDP